MCEWDKYGRCACGMMQRAPFGDLFHIHFEVCPRCGRDVEGEWKVVTARWRNRHFKWWNPKTWGLGDWEVKGEDGLSVVARGAR